MVCAINSGVALRSLVSKGTGSISKVGAQTSFLQCPLFLFVPFSRAPPKMGHEQKVWAQLQHKLRTQPMLPALDDKGVAGRHREAVKRFTG